MRERVSASRLHSFARLFRHLNLRLSAPNMQATEINVVTNRDKTMPTTVEEMSQIVRAAAEPWHPGDSIKHGINRASRALGLSPRRAITFWYARPAAVLAEEADKLRAWHRTYVEREAARLESRLAELKERQKALRATHHGLAMDGTVLSDAGRVLD